MFRSKDKWLIIKITKKKKGGILHTSKAILGFLFQVIVEISNIGKTESNIPFNYQNVNKYYRLFFLV